ncbi:uncharacterized protein LOC131670807 [Phymastichus coffea]|uniref:uncharacterized protein LOC131670807 n=1 Tax=Phymastichus coffea TaxID=108790 RepID=UPI00273B4975|nr:uncharacterized protein LOC131670807 [Phymastichus coffea]
MGDYNALIKYDNIDECYCVLFKNQYALEREEINEIFSQCGHVYKIRLAGDNTGYWFIKYKFWDEAKRTVDDLRYHPKIKLSKHNSKQKDCRTTEKNQNNGQGRKECDGTKLFQQFRKQANNKNDKSGNFNENEYHGNFNNRKNDLPWGPKGATRNKKQDHLVQGRNNCEENYDGLPELVDRTKKVMVEEQQSIEDEVPELTTTNGRTSTISNSIKKIIPAHEVVVANIHPLFGASYILYLLDRYKPLAITNIMVEPKTAKRYCYVYFRSAKQSQQVEINFDKTSLLDQKLVVIRSSQLTESVH